MVEEARIAWILRQQRVQLPFSCFQYPEAGACLPLAEVPVCWIETYQLLGNLHGRDRRFGSALRVPQFPKGSSSNNFDLARGHQQSTIIGRLPKHLPAQSTRSVEVLQTGLD